MPELVAVKEITIEAGLHCRDSLNLDAVSRYSEILHDLPPVKLVRVGDTLLLASGHHRYEAYAKAGIETIPAEIIDGARLDAMKIGLKDNLRHGVPLTKDERNRAIVMLVEEKLLYREIGEIFGLGDDAISVIALKAGRRRRGASINEKGNLTKDAKVPDPILSGPSELEENLETGEFIPAAEGAATYQPASRETADSGATVEAGSTPEEAVPAEPSPMTRLTLDLNAKFTIGLRPAEWVALVTEAEGNSSFSKDDLAVAAARLVKGRFSGYDIPWERIHEATLEDVDPPSPTDGKSATEEPGLLDSPPLSIHDDRDEDETMAVSP